VAKKLFVGNLPYSVDEAALREMFAELGEVTSASIVTDRDTGRSRGFGFVEMANDPDAEAAIEAMNGQTVDGRRLTVNEARPREPRRDMHGRRGR
jgi:cold-inducible RNA-binding protein